MIDTIHDMCRDWGAYMRRTTPSWGSKNTAWKLWREQGASTKDKGSDYVPKGALDIFDPSNADINEIHIIYRQMPEDLHEIMWASYVLTGSKESRAKWLGVKPSMFYELRGKAQHYIWGRLGSPCIVTEK